VITPIGIDSVYAVVSILTDIGCQVLDSIKIVNFPTDAEISLSDGSSPDQVTLEEDNFVPLSTNLTSVSWEPEDIIDNPTATSVTVFPAQPTTAVTVTGTDDNGCLVSTDIEIILNNLRPKKTFSPNGDGINDCWEILNSSQPNTEGCKIFVFDARGRNILEDDAPFADNCVWDGNSGSTPVPEGVYYFIFNCDDNANGIESKTGSILLAR